VPRMPVANAPLYLPYPGLVGHSVWGVVYDNRAWPAAEVAAWAWEAGPPPEPPPPLIVSLDGVPQPGWEVNLNGALIGTAGDRIDIVTGA
jgi:hypothetical protein